MARLLTDSWVCVDAQAIYDHRCAMSCILGAYRTMIYEKIGYKALSSSVDTWCHMMIACDEIEPDRHDFLSRSVSYLPGVN